MAVWSVPYESSTAVRSSLVGWCEGCAVVYDPYPGPKTECDCEHDEMPWEYHKRLRKRRMWKCPHCDMYYLSRPLLLDHEHTWLF